MSDPTLPPGLTQENLKLAMGLFAGAIGSEHVFFTETDRLTYKDKFALDDNKHQPLGALAPLTAEEVQSIVKIAAQYKVPLWPISRGKNLGYGGSAPMLSGSVVLDMSRMKKIDVDVENGTVLLEPGVGFYDLYDYLQSRNLPLWISVPGNSWGSVIGNALDRGVGYTPYGEHPSKICGMEVVLPDGDLVRTGSGAIDGSNTWQLYRYGFGPSWDHVFVQSNFGVVTKMGMWLMPAPESVMGLDIEFDKPEDLGPLVDILGKLRREGFIQHVPSIGNWLRAAAVMTTRDQWTDQPGALSDEVISTIRKHYNIGWWGVSLRLFEREEINKIKLAILEKEMSKLKPLSVKKFVWRQGEPVPPFAGAWMGIPITFPMQNANWHGGRGGHIGFSPIMPQSGKLAQEQFEKTYAMYKHFGMDYQASFTLGERHLVNVNAALLNKDDAAMMAKVEPFIRELIKDSRSRGYAEYRTHLDLMDPVAATYDFNNKALLRLNEKVKNALDPAGIIAPGKSGIWPANYVKERQS